MRFMTSLLIVFLTIVNFCGALQIKTVKGGCLVIDDKNNDGKVDDGEIVCGLLTNSKCDEITFDLAGTNPVKLETGEALIIKTIEKDKAIEATYITNSLGKSKWCAPIPNKTLAYKKPIRLIKI